MDKKDHIKLHIELHESLDKLIADFLFHTEGILSETTVFELLEWSFRQVTEPTEKHI